MTKEEMLAIFKSVKDKMIKGAKKLDPVAAVERAAVARLEADLAKQAAKNKTAEELAREAEERLAPITKEIEKTTKRGGSGAAAPASQATQVPRDEGLTDEEVAALSYGYIGQGQNRKKEALRLKKALEAR